jgi:tetratricopeptide (TPR) repeat protein
MSEKEVDKPELPAQDAEATTGDNSAPDFVTPAPTVITRTENKPPVWMWIGLGVLTITALLVIFVLPTLVQEYELPLERRVATTQPAPAAPAPAAAAISPFEEAQRAIQRKEAQDVLAELLEHQAELERLEVGSWAAERYEAALEQASVGDEYYRTQDFQSATSAYAAVRDELLALLNSESDVLASILAEAQQALADEDSTRAEERFSLALVFDPDNEAAQIGLQRARTLDEVLALITRAEAEAEDGDLQAALASYREAESLDAYNELIPQRVAAINAQIRSNEFNRIMSSGYALLEQGQPQEAIAAFERAANMGVNEEQARAAIVQTETQVANAEIAIARQHITEAEAAELWQQAVTHYDTVLGIDANLTFAIQGRDYAAKRAQLDRLLVEAIDNPERFAEDAVYQQTVDVYFTGRAIENPGPRLQGQLDELQGLLENSQVPRTVTLVSDNLTQVTVLREAELGLFQQTTLSLKPGNYVAIGRRAGYREVREEFTVGFGQTPEQVVVRCVERVATSR